MCIAILCSGQGRQHAEMFALTGDAAEATGLFAQGQDLLGGSDPRELVRSGSYAELHHDRAGQILCTLQALAAAASLGEVLSDRVIVAGYSVGELAGWGVTGRLNPAQTLDLAAFRAEAMDAVSQPGDGLLSVRGLARHIIDELCERHDAAVAIINPAEDYIVGGGRDDLDALAAEAKALNVTRVTMLPVEVASHTPRLSSASAVFRDRLRQLALPASPSGSMRLLSSIDSAPVIDLSEGLDKLAEQISRTVRWADCLQACVERGARAFLELGPGSALSRMAAATYPDTPARALDDFRSIQGVQAWIARHVGDDGILG